MTCSIHPQNIILCFELLPKPALDTLIKKRFFSLKEMNDFRGYVTDITVKKEPLVCTVCDIKPALV